MSRDESYCSSNCRRKGHSAKYTEYLHGSRGSSMRPRQPAEDFADGADTADGSSVVSESVSNFDGTDRSCSSKWTGTEPGGRWAGRPGVLGWIMAVGLRQLTAMTGVPELLRAASTDACDFGEVGYIGQRSMSLNRSCGNFRDLAGEDRKGSGSDFVHLIEGF